MAWSDAARAAAAEARKRHGSGTKAKKLLRALVRVKGLNGLYPAKDVKSWSASHLKRLRYLAKTYK